MEGVVLYGDDSQGPAICAIKYLSDDIKELIRTELSSICFGNILASTGRIPFAYENTLREFLTRYQSKSYSIKVGMLGELLCHVFLPKYFPRFLVASPFFNMEERSIRKGFDIVLYEDGHDDAWFAEVKSGEVGSIGCKNKKAKALIELAKNDLIDRFTANSSTTWYSALNGIRNALSETSKAKKVLESRIDSFILSSGANGSPSEQNAVLVPVLFEDSSNLVEIEALLEKEAAIVSSGVFSRFMIFAIQKSTVTALEEFLENESSE